MPRDVLLRKIALLRQLLRDMQVFETATQAEVEAQHYAIERIFELMVGVASDLVFHILAERGVTPSSYRDAFRLAGQEHLLPADLATQLQQAAGMRNILVHMYEDIDYAILHQSIQPTLRDFGRFVVAAEQWNLTTE